jgi:uncharacterized membrane protein (Fun14 family)
MDILFPLYVGLVGFLFGWCSRRENKPAIQVHVDRSLIDLWLEKKGMVAVKKGALAEKE